MVANLCERETTIPLPVDIHQNWELLSTFRYLGDGRGREGGVEGLPFDNDSSQCFEENGDREYANRQCRTSARPEERSGDGEWIPTLIPGCRGRRDTFRATRTAVESLRPTLPSWHTGCRNSHGAMPEWKSLCSNQEWTKKKKIRVTNERRKFRLPLNVDAQEHSKRELKCQKNKKEQTKMISLTNK